MQALKPGTKAPDFRLKTALGEEFALSKALLRGPVVLAFYKIGCPVCQYAMPYVERLNKALQKRGVRVIGVSEDGYSDTRAFMKEYGLTMETALDEERTNYAVSNAYGLTNVPTVFEIAQDGTIETTIVSWSRDELAAIHAKYAADDAKSSPLFKPEENVSEYRIG